MAELVATPAYILQVNVIDLTLAMLTINKKMFSIETGTISLYIINFLQDENFSLSLLNELSLKYGMQTHLSHSPLPQKLEELREYIRREIKKELKIKEGAENLRKVAKDKKSVSDVNVIVKKSNSKLTELKQELQELESQILVSQGNTNMTPGTYRA